MKLALTAVFAFAQQTFDSQYPGTAVDRLEGIHERVKSVNLSGDWNDVRRKILQAGGLRDITSAKPG